MQVTSLLSRKEHDHEHGESCASCGHDHTPIRLKQTLAGLLFVINSFLVEWMQLGPAVSEVSAAIGAMLLGYPIIVTAYKDLRRSILSTNELVAIAGKRREHSDGDQFIRAEDTPAEVLERGDDDGVAQ